MTTQNAGEVGMAMPAVEEVNWARRLRTDGVQYHRGEWMGYRCAVIPMPGRPGLYEAQVERQTRRYGESYRREAEGMKAREAVEWCLAWMGRAREGEEERRLARERELAGSLKSFRAMDRLLGLSDGAGNQG